MQELAPGLLRWTARHPEWAPGGAPDSPADWPEEVGSVAYEAPDAFLLVDPLVPDSLWETLEERIRRHRQRVAVLTTLKWHRRSRDEVVARFGASTTRARRALPAGVETIPLRGAGETLIWLPEVRTLVPGDRILGAAGGGLRLCPDSWLAYLGTGLTRAGLREKLLPLLELPIERVLVSHGEPVLAGGRAALAEALRPE